MNKTWNRSTKTLGNKTRPGRKTKLNPQKKLQDRNMNFILPHIQEVVRLFSFFIPRQMDVLHFLTTFSKFLLKTNELIFSKSNNKMKIKNRYNIPTS